MQRKFTGSLSASLWKKSHRSALHQVGTCVALASVALLSACGGDSSGDNPVVTPPAAASLLSCDTSNMQAAFKPDANTSVVSAKLVKKGEIVTGVDSPTHKVTLTNDICLVKLLVGPGNTSEPTTAPSYSAGIGIEVWLPAKDTWNQRIRNYGGGGWVGGGHRYADQIGSKIPAIINANIGYVSSTHDGGQPLFQDGSFIMKADGTVNQTLTKDFWYRSIYEQAVKTKALVKAYYGNDAKFAYMEGQSTGGMQTLKALQEFPEMYDGYVVAAPAINSTKFHITGIYTQLVMKNDLGYTALDTALATAFDNKYKAVNTRAVQACDPNNLGYILDPFACTYDPAKDAAALCVGQTGTGGVAGTNSTATCVSLVEANAINKIWYGATFDGSFDPNQSYDSRSGKFLGNNQLWWNWAKGANNASILAPVSTDSLAMYAQDVRYATSIPGSYSSAAKAFVNSSTSVRDKWLGMTYGDLNNILMSGLTMQEFLGRPNADSPDLSKAVALKRKVLMYGGLADGAIPTAGWINYYTRVSTAMGGLSATQNFFRMYMIPGMAHSSTGASTTLGNPFSGYPANKAPLPLMPGPNNTAPAESQDQMFTALKNWVENGVAPSDITIFSGDKTVGYPICVYPKKITWNGTSDAKLPTSYSCQ
jgi:pimeloyl-ACP methyl ester carboxylesterase